MVIRTDGEILEAGGAFSNSKAVLDEMDMIRLSVPGTLQYRDVVLRVVTSACKLVRALAKDKQEASREAADFDDKVVSAVGEAFNNVAIHAYRDVSPEAVELEIDVSGEGITIRMSDTGHVFEPKQEVDRQPDLATLPESHMGLFIMRSCMDKVTYRPRVSPEVPNQLTLTKRFKTD
ncbi:MAG TPA: ATP-binding protein [Polyangiaceae bacterium]|nr:ATP-binding protein [Polyangiaceae bacterium]